MSNTNLNVVGGNQNLRSKISKSAEGYPKLGTVIYWSIEGFSQPYSAVLEAFSNVGLPSDFASPVQTKSALIKALKAHTKGKKNTFHRSVMDNKDRAGFAVLNTEVLDESTMEVTAVTSTKAVLNKNSKDVTIDGPESEAIREAFNGFRETYTSDRFRNSILKVIKSHAMGVSVRDSGGVYFIPSSHDYVVEMLQKLFSHFNGCSLELIPVIDTAEAKASMWKSLVGDASRDLQEFKLDLDSSAIDMSERSIEVRMKKYQALRDKVENYEFLLQGTAGNLKQELDQLTQKLVKKMAA